MNTYLSDEELMELTRNGIMTPNETREIVSGRLSPKYLSDRELIERIEELTNNEFTVRMNYDIIQNELKYMFWKESTLKYTVATRLYKPYARDPWHIANEVLKLENEEMKAQKPLSDPPKPAEYVPIKCKVCGAPMTHGQLKCIYCGQEYLKIERN